MHMYMTAPSSAVIAIRDVCPSLAVGVCTIYVCVCRMCVIGVGVYVVVCVCGVWA